MQSIKVYVGGGPECFYMNSKDNQFRKIMITLWDHLSNEDDRPSKKNVGNQLPMCNIYEDTLELDKYLGVGFFFGAKRIGNMTFGSVDGLVCDGLECPGESLIWCDDGSCNINTLLPILNSSLEPLDFNLVLEE